ncbi:MAG: DeoR/GlpR family DNA-binding transcription regulator [Atopobiaceae bacterium]|nr:DeoR/GlpR family DNA-binding transcription regulator [Atopobiaceae bacterium]MCH4180206.1 DeoR/GlpR family DNA-binding transcription regulator [Atopobiaceae bacterium]MCH4214376.1 DeoR/GlpR family DNA-binding transcription regulator [Atopobiaceae bacterium]MCH4229193.1 DeoR/GlpR family DNA-binding transcription regulator [Atopobiaceae bacterium]MCH4276564.1 DeoR/GlpR family DNA-binding transcription regulator [Atopobiaceae bacterium]
MLKAERQDAITKICTERGTVTVSDVAGELDVSEMTVRRDLEELSAVGKVERVHGGARSITGKRGLAIPREFSHDEKRQIHKAEKQRIARMAASLIRQGDTIFLGTGTTIETMTQLLPKGRLRVITNSLPVFNLLEDHDDFDLCLVGGLYRPHTGAFVGPMAEEAVSSLGIDKAFIGANGILEHAASTSNMEEGKLQQLVFDKADMRYLVADSSKLGKRDFYTFYDLVQVDGLVTDDQVTPEQREVVEQYTQVIS